MIRGTKILSVISLALATLTLLVFAMVPHHHHGAAVCMVIAHCTQNNNAHSEHNSCDSANHNDACLTETEYIALNDSVKCKVLSCDNNSHNHIHLLPLICVFLDAILGGIDVPIHQYEYGKHQSIYKFAYFGQSNTLRAPPVFI